MSGNFTGDSAGIVGGSSNGGPAASTCPPPQPPKSLGEAVEDAYRCFLRSRTRPEVFLIRAKVSAIHPAVTSGAVPGTGGSAAAAEGGDAPPTEPPEADEHRRTIKALRRLARGKYREPAPGEH